jgi:hypothetical protein
MEYRHARAAAIDPIEYQAMQMDVAIGGEPKRWMSVTAPVWLGYVSVPLV